MFHIKFLYYIKKDETIFNIVIYLISGKLLSKPENCKTHCMHVHWNMMGAKTMAEENGETRASRGRSNKCEYARANIDVIHTNTHG